MLFPARRILLLGLLATFAPGLGPSAMAQVQLGPNGPFTPEKPGVPQSPKPGGPFATCTVAMPSKTIPSLPADALWPRIGQLTPGNSVTYWYRAIAGLDRASQLQPEEFRKAFGGGATVPWIDMPVAELPREEVRQYLTRWTENLSNARIAALREQTEWSLRMRDLRGLATIEYRLGEFQEARALMRLIKLKMQLALADGDFVQAADWARTGLRLAHALDDNECIIIDLVGIACASITQVGLADLIALPDSPSLYWALAGIPESLVQCRDSIDTELTLPERVFPWFSDAELHPRTSEGWRGDFRQTLRDSRQLTSDSRRMPKQDAPDWLVDVYLLQALLNGYPGAVRDLEADGIPHADLDAMPVGQVVAVHQIRSTHRTELELLKWTRRADPAFVERIDREFRSQSKLPFANAAGPSHTTFLAEDLMPAVQQALKAEWRLVIRHRALMVVEALRLHAAQHHGQLPASLDEITVVPVPRHPVTLQHFPYTVTGNVAVLDAPTGFPGEDYILIRFHLNAGKN